MRVQKNPDRVGKNVIVQMDVLYSVIVSGIPLGDKLTIEYLKGGNTSMVVQTTLEGGEPVNWDFAAIADGDFMGDKLKGFKEYATDACPDAQKPVIVLRTIIIHESEHVFQQKPSRAARAEAQVVHSRVRHLD